MENSSLVQSSQMKIDKGICFWNSILLLNYIFLDIFVFSICFFKLTSFSTLCSKQIVQFLKFPLQA